VAEAQKQKKGKRPKTAKSAAQYYRTAKNKTKARAHHAKLNPDDEQAKANWKAHPIRLKKGDPK
jgi:hypothetical protein